MGNLLKRQNQRQQMQEMGNIFRQNNPNFVNQIVRRHHLSKKGLPVNHPSTCIENDENSKNTIEESQSQHINFDLNEGIPTFGNWRKSNQNGKSRDQVGNIKWKGLATLKINMSENLNKEFFTLNPAINLDNQSKRLRSYSRESNAIRHRPIIAKNNKMPKQFFSRNQLASMSRNKSKESSERYSRRESATSLEEDVNTLKLKTQGNGKYHRLSYMNCKSSTLDVNCFNKETGSKGQSQRESQRERERQCAKIKQSLMKLYSKMKQSYEKLLKKHGVKQTVDEKQFLQFLRA